MKAYLFKYTVLIGPELERSTEYALVHATDSGKAMKKMLAVHPYINTKTLINLTIE